MTEDNNTVPQDNHREIDIFSIPEEMRRYSLKIAASIIGKSVRTVKRRIAERQLVACYDGHPFIWHKDLVDYLNKNKRKDDNDAV